MRKVNRIRARVGDVFAVPVSVDLRVHGQVIDQAGFQFLVILFRSITGPLDPNYPPVKTSPPWFAVGHEQLGNLRLVSFDGATTRTLAAAEASRHRNRTIANPMALQRAAEAVHHRREW